MYVSYLYARKYDLLAIRMMLKDGTRDLSKWLPIVEAVTADISSLKRCIGICAEDSQGIGIVVNPQLHELAPANAAKAWWGTMEHLVAGNLNVVPVLRCGEATTIAQVQGFAAHFQGREVAVALFGVTGLGANAAVSLAAQANIRWFLVKDGLPTAFANALPVARKVLLKDCFVRQARNADYGGVEFFTDRHQTFHTTAAGIGDFLCLGENFNDGGGPPGAVAIHAIFQEQQGGLVMIEHFLSDDQVQGESDTAAKFIQAAQKLVHAIHARPVEFGANLALTEYEKLVATNHSPGLGTSKKLQIVHHVSRMLDVIP